MNKQIVTLINEFRIKIEKITGERLAELDVDFELDEARLAFRGGVLNLDLDLEDEDGLLDE